MPWPLACAVAVVGAWLLPSPVFAQLALPDNFVDDLMVDGLDQPVGLAFLPDGRALVVERLTGKIRLVVNGALAEIDPVITVTGVNTTGLERGLLGIAVDPQWPVRPYLYIHYTSVVGPSVHIQRLTAEGDLAFTGNGSLTINQLSRYNILADIPDQSYQHNGGTVRFGPDGRLYVSIGDDANACQAQTMEILAGKILRLRVSSLPPGGGGPPQRSTITPLDNPFVTNPDSNARLVLHQGLRNPFRFGIDPVTGGLVIGDVGEGNMEELDYVTLPANLEWPIFEGTLVGPTTCPDVDFSRFEAPIYTYDHIEGQAVNGGIVYRRPDSAPHPFPPEYEGDILFCDFYSSWFRRLKNNGLFWEIAVAAGQPDPENWANSGGYISDIVEAPDGSVWYCQMLPTSGSGPGSLHRIRYTGQVSVPSPARAALEFRAPHPSPSNGTVWFDYALDREAEVKLTIYDVAGRLLTRIVAGETRGAGPHRSSWDGRDDRGHDVASGVYVAVLAADGRRIERRFAVAR